MLLFAAFTSLATLTRGDALQASRFGVPMEGIFRNRCQCDPDVTSEYYECDEQKPWQCTEDRSASIFGAAINGAPMGCTIKNVEGSAEAACKRCSLFAASVTKEIMKRLGLNVHSGNTVCFYCKNNVMGESFLHVQEKNGSPSGSYGEKCIHWSQQTIHDG